jgi:ADP-ribose pyrophosphatase YjhB (NUDIX family)
MATVPVRLLARVWHRLGGGLQWRLLWLTQAKFLVGVAGVIRDDEGRVLLLRHRFWPEGSWGLPGGYAHGAERLEDALARELREETGCRIEGQRLLSVNSGYRMRVEVVFTARLAGNVTELDRREVLAAELFRPEALPSGLLRDHRRLIALAVGRGVQPGRNEQPGQPRQPPPDRTDGTAGG